MRNLSRIPVVGIYDRPFRLRRKERISFDDLSVVRIAVGMVAISVEYQSNFAMNRQKATLEFARLCHEKLFTVRPVISEI